MLGGLLSGGLQLLRTLAPTAINWGLNKLMNSGAGQRYLTPQVLQGVSGVVDMAKQFATQRPDPSDQPTMPTP